MFYVYVSKNIHTKRSKKGGFREHVKFWRYSCKVLKQACNMLFFWSLVKKRDFDTHILEPWADIYNTVKEIIELQYGARVSSLCHFLLPRFGVLRWLPCLSL